MIFSIRALTAGMLTAALTACSGTGLSPAPPHMVATHACPLSYKVANSATVGTCYGGSGAMYSFRTTLNGGDYSSDTSATSAYTASGSSTNNSTGEVVPTNAGVSADVTNGVSTINETVRSVSSQPVTLRYLDAKYVQPGANTMPAGGTLNMDATNGTATGDFTDAKGRSWHLTGSPNADGHTVDVQFSSSAGDSGTLQVDGDSVAPAQMALMPLSSMHTAMGVGGRHTMRNWGKAAVVGGVVAAGLGVVAAGLGVVAVVGTAPVWVPVAAAGIGLAGALVGFGAASAAYAAWLQDQKARK